MPSDMHTNICMCVCVCVCTYTHTHTHTHTRTHAHTHTNTHRHTHTHIHTHIHRHTYIHTHKHTYTHAYKRMHTNKHTYTHTQTHTHTCTHTHTNDTHKQTHTHTQTHTHICMYVYRLAFTAPLVFFRSLALFLARESPSRSLSPPPRARGRSGYSVQMFVISKLTDSLCVSFALTLGSFVQSVLGVQTRVRQFASHTRTRIHTYTHI